MALAWIASYPRSGNTWTRILLANYLQDEQVELEMNRLRAMHPGVPDLFHVFSQGRLLPLDDPRPRAVKTHFLPGVDVLRPYRDATRKVLYLVRNPRDVILSVERFLHVSPARKADFARNFIAHRGLSIWRRTGFGSWPQSLREWTSPERLRQHFPNADVCVVRYEDMKQDTVAALRKMVDFLGFDTPADPERVRRAVAHSALDKLRAAERRVEPPAAERFPFFGPGLSGQSLAGYGADVEEAYRRLLKQDEEFSALVEKYGYAGGEDRCVPSPG
ncbi:sulfotransferase domain-containing protein [Phytohabitans houttuyneae]|uniref:Sulfotransferase n=1 Tax=Phytohabitans houttuyneae TaxID=1076126 RepID=A0A6V8KGC2_9ACTN|nr:sulfotransferase domain-containing protein [Phytohabitans houttuyneae]GFJ82430.1 sulfotransferase [Phytohabitans houttuyneae]